MSRSAESATPILLSSLQLLAPAVVAPLELPDRGAPAQGLDGPLELAPQAQRGDRSQEQVVDEREAPQDLVAVGRVRDDHDRRLVRAAGAQPGLGRALLGLEQARVGDHQGGLPPVERGLQRGERAHLVGPEARRRRSPATSSRVSPQIRR